MMLLKVLDSEVGNLPCVATACNESKNLKTRDSYIITVPNYRCEGAAACGVWTERYLGQRR